MERAHVEVDNARMMTPKTGAYPKLTRTVVAPRASIRVDNAPSWWLVHFYMSKITDWSEALTVYLYNHADATRGLCGGRQR